MGNSYDGKTKEVKTISCMIHRLPDEVIHRIAAGEVLSITIEELDNQTILGHTKNI
jgi:hypothetical protein